MTIRAPFQPRRGTNDISVATTTSASISIDPKAKSVRLVNTGTTDVCHVRIGAGAQTATTGDFPVLPSSSVIVSKGEGEDTAAFITGAGTAGIHIQTGEGGI